MANNLKESLNELMQIDGAVAVALVDGNSGMAMGTAGGGPLNLEVAAAGNSEVVRSKLKVMKALNLRESIEDILISLNSQYHIIRPLAKNPEIFVYLVLNRSSANLAMARYKLAAVEKDLHI
ncbi:roadblock/LC7 domain-containing protein [bacterium]|nr:MAG: roadblock/LC7 domain-containing protein [bacterium]